MRLGLLELDQSDWLGRRTIIKIKFMMKAVLESMECHTVDKFI